MKSINNWNHLDISQNFHHKINTILKTILNIFFLNFSKKEKKRNPQIFV